VTEGAALELIDANAVVRYLVRDDADHTARASRLIDSDRPLRIAASTIAEISFTLLRVYKFPRTRICDVLIDLVERSNIHVHEFDTDVAVEALQLCRPSGRVSFADAMLWAVARTSSPARVWTFDERFPADGIDVQAP